MGMSMPRTLLVEQAILATGCNRTTAETAVEMVARTSTRRRMNPVNIKRYAEDVKRQAEWMRYRGEGLEDPLQDELMNIEDKLDSTQEELSATTERMEGLEKAATKTEDLLQKAMLILREGLDA